MSYKLAPTGDFTGDKTLKNGVKNFDVKYRLVSTDFIERGEAWGIAWNQMILKFAYFRGAPLKSVSIDGKGETWGQVFDVTGRYSVEESEEPTWATLTFSTRGGREKKIHAFATTAYPAHGETRAPDFHHGIGFNNNVFQGVDVVVPHLGFSVDVDLPSTQFNDAMFSFFHRLTGSANAQPLWIFGKGELLFNGLSGNSYRKKNRLNVYELWFKLSFEFEAQPTVTGGTIPPFTNVTKEGWQYFWTFHQDAKDSTSNITVPRPVAAYVETVYPYADFSWFSQLQW